MKHHPPFHHTRLVSALLIAGLLILAVALGLAVSRISAAPESPLHPTFPLLDANGDNVLETGNPVSTMRTCGACHDTEFIAEHNAHENLLTGEIAAPAGEAIMIDPTTGRLTALQGAAQSTEMNCFLCHWSGSNNHARLEALASGRSEWANTATLVGSGVVEQTGNSFAWNLAAFDADGELLREYVFVGDPTVENCGQCHGVATTDAITPLALDVCGTVQGMTIRTGEVFSPQRISESGLNIADKESHSRTWDVHAERIVACTDCHYALNNPAYATTPGTETPKHLVFDPRRLEPGEYLYQPLHELARSEADTLTGERCASCHDARKTHTWLPYTDRHMDRLACETCHVAQIELSARQMIDWTVLTPLGTPAFTCRGIETNADGERNLIIGYTPALLPTADGNNAVIAPYNLVTTYYWVYGADETPVALSDLQAAYFDGSVYHPDVLAAFDANGDGMLDSNELVIDNDAKEAVIADRLTSLGLADPRIAARVDAYPIHHSVTHGEWATRDCSTCHGKNSRLAQPVTLVSNPPGGVLPTLEGDLGQSGEISVKADGTVLFAPSIGQPEDRLYIFGYSASAVVDWAGAVIFLGVLGAVFVHGGLRVLAARRHAAHRPPELRVYYMYSVYERLWHWLQTGAILILIFTGLVIHKPDLFRMFSFAYVVQVHNIIAALLVINAALSLFYHLASGEIRQYLPRPYGFFDSAILQAKFYLRGIFRGEEHPFSKTPKRKLNPLQQITYLGLLNVLLPLQILTGVLMWGAQRWPDLVARLGGLPFLAPLHTLIAWLLAAFVVAHVYLTTTGHAPLASIRAMILGYDEIAAYAEAD